MEGDGEGERGEETTFKKHLDHPFTVMHPFVLQHTRTRTHTLIKKISSGRSYENYYFHVVDDMLGGGGKKITLKQRKKKQNNTLNLLKPQQAS